MFKNIFLLFSLLSVGLAINRRKFVPCSNPDDFHCSIGNLCIDSELECDGKKHCPDGSDESEAYCEYKLCRPPRYYMCNDNVTCVLEDWRCDDEYDCPTRDDEHNCVDGVTEDGPIECSADEFACVLDEICIGNEFVCNGFAQCIDGSDEMNCNKSGTSNCTSEYKMFLCSDNVTCLAIENVCNDENDCSDGSDEGDFCSKFNNSSACESNLCPDNVECLIQSTGPVCVCPEGFTYDSQQRICEDIDECQTYGICSQGCVNTPGSYYCTCAYRFRLKIDNSSCETVGRTEPLLFYAIGKSINMVHLRSGNQSVVTEKGQIIGLSFDGVYVYWTNVALGTESIVKARVDGTKMETLLATGLSLPEDIAVDLVTGNLYISDALFMHIAVCSNDGKYCKVLITENVERPRGIALYPQEGLMYWSDWGSQPMIGVARMDGGSAKPLIRDNIRWPSGITVDWPNNRLYWVDANLKLIESCKLDGSGRQIVVQNALKHPYGLAVFENNIYWSDWGGKGVETCNKFTCKERQVFVKGRKVYDLHIYHSSMRPYSKNPCRYNECTHLCLLAPNTSLSCACPTGMTLDIDQISCITTTEKESIYIGIGNSLIKMEHETFGRHQIDKPKHLSIYIQKMTFNSLNGHVFLADNFAQIIWDYDFMNDKKLELVTTNIGMVSSMSFDHLSNNLYWSDSELGTIEVLSLNRNHRAVVRQYFGTAKPIAIAVIPEKGRMFVASRTDSGQTQIDIQSLDGSGDYNGTIESQLGDKLIQFAVDRRVGTIYFCDSDMKRISRTDHTGRPVDVFKQISSESTSIAILRDDVFYTVNNSLDVFSTPKHRGDSTKRLILPQNPNVVQRVDSIVVVATSPTFNVSQHPCMTDNGGCTHICVTSNATQRICLCPAGMNFTNDQNNTCTEIEPENCEYRCGSGECITSLQQCNNVNDCADASDESDCDPREEDQVNCHQNECRDGVAIELRCDKKVDCNDKSDEADCTRDNSANKCNKNEFPCSDQCIDLKTVCEGWFERLKVSHLEGN